MTSKSATSFAEHGVEVVEGILDDQTTDELTRLCEPLLAGSNQRKPGVRRVLGREPRLAQLLQSGPAAKLIKQFAGHDARIIRSIIFDKSPETNWAVPWHQDATVGLAERVETPGFGPWAIKDGEHHCQPPREILDSIVVVRISLDPCPANAGPLLVVADSHRSGLLDATALASAVARGPIIECTSDWGGAVLMRPLSIHSSKRSVDWPHRRRVLHLECSAAELPPGLQWAECHD